MRLNNPVKETLRAGGAAIGVFIPMPSPDVVEIVALAGFDFALLDAEHGRISPDDAYPMILAAEARDIPASCALAKTIARSSSNTSTSECPA